MITMKDFDEGSWAAGRPYLVGNHWQGENRSYRQPLYRHAEGVVEIYEQTGSNPLTNMRFRYGGRDYYRTWRTTWGDKTLARLAREFIESVVDAS